MHTFAKTIALLAPFAFSAAVTTAQAETPSTMTCYSGSVAAITLPITSISFDLPTGSPMGYFTVTAPFSQFNSLAEDHFSYPTLDSCAFTPGNGTAVYGITISDVSAHSDAAEQYSSITLSYSTIAIGPSAAATAIPKPKVALTPDQQQKFLTDYLARVPRPSTSTK